MSDSISVPITEESINVVINGGDALLGINGTHSIDFAIPLAIDGTTYKDWKCSNVSGNTTLNLTGVLDGEGGMIELINSVSGVITMGSMFTKNAGGGTCDSAASGDNLIAWYKSGSDIIYSITQIE